MIDLFKMMYILEEQIIVEMMFIFFFEDDDSFDSDVLLFMYIRKGKIKKGQ